MDFSTAYASRGAAQVDFLATVTSAPRFFQGAHSRYEHEAFDASSPSGPLEVVDNVDIAPRCPVEPGDQVEVCGEMVHDRGKPPIVHWTHHDPQNRHAGGFIRLHGKLYA
jgi:Protein of unknown function (DUF3465)